MAKAKKTRSSSKARKPKKSKRLTRSALVTRSSGILIAANVNVVFTSGLGQLTATLFRNGVLINMQSISTSGGIQFSDVQSRDSISVNGVCTGAADITVTVPTNPPTPEHFAAGIIMSGYTIL